MKRSPMNTRIKLLIIFSVIVVMTACSSREEKLAGVWVVKDVAIDADTTKLSKQQIERTEEMQKAVHFEIGKDKSIEIISAGESFPGTWHIEDENDDIYVKLEGAAMGDSIKIGKFENGKIISRDKAPAGWVTVTYIKE